MWWPVRGMRLPARRSTSPGSASGARAGTTSTSSNSQNIVALCDVDWQQAAGVFDRYPNAKKYKDFREMLDKEDKNIDGVVVGTPDHMHAIVSMAAIKRGKHVYCEKPLTHTVREAKLLADAAREAKVATQMGNQGQASEETRLLCETIWDGAIGQVREVHIWTDRPLNGIDKWYWPQGVGRPAGRGSDPRDARLGPLDGPGADASVCATGSIIRSSGEAGGISAPARWATSAATAWTQCSAP